MLEKLEVVKQYRQSLEYTSKELRGEPVAAGSIQGSVPVPSASISRCGQRRSRTALLEYAHQRAPQGSLTSSTGRRARTKG